MSLVVVGILISAGSRFVSVYSVGSRSMLPFLYICLMRGRGVRIRTSGIAHKSSRDIGRGGEKPVTGDASICFSLKWLEHWFGGVCSGHLLILNKPCPLLWQQRWPLCIADIDSIGMRAHEHKHDTYDTVKTGKGFFLSVPERQPTTIRPKSDWPGLCRGISGCCRCACGYAAGPVVLCRPVVWCYCRAFTVRLPQDNLLFMF